MIKKILLAAVIGAVAFAAVKHTRFGGYARDEAASIGEWIESKVPVEKKIKQLRKEISTLDREIDKASDELAKEIVEVEHLTRDIDREKAALIASEKKVRTAAEAIAHTTEKVATYGRLIVNIDDAKAMLNDDVKRIVTRKQTLQTMQDTLVSREKIKDALVKQVDEIKRQKRELATSVDRLEADYKQLQLAQIESKYQFDDTKLSGVKKSLQELQKEIDIKKTKLKLAPTVASETPAPTSTQSVEDILAPLNGAKSEKASN